MLLSHSYSQANVKGFKFQHTWQQYFRENETTLEAFIKFERKPHNAFLCKVARKLGGTKT